MTIKNLFRYIVRFVFIIAVGRTVAAPQVLMIDPPHHAMVPAGNLVITVDFSESIDTTMVDHLSFSVSGRWAGAACGSFSFENDNRRVRFQANQEHFFSAGEWITVTLSTAIINISGEPLTKGYQWNFWTQTNPATLKLAHTETIPVRFPGENRIRTYGAYAGDFNHDGYHDFVAPNEDANDFRVFMNDATGNYSGAFTQYMLPEGSKPSTNEGADFNGDGHLDFVVGNIEGGTVSVFFGDGTGKLDLSAHYSTGLGTRGLCVLDLNSDGMPDIVTANRETSDISKLINNGSGGFQPAVNQDGGPLGETSCVAADANRDGLLDVFVGGFDSKEIITLLSDGNGGLTETSRVSAGGGAWMLAVGDLNGDGNVDIVSANANQHNFTVLFGNSGGELTLVQTLDTGFFPLAVDVGDIDGDSDLDVVISSFSRDWRVFANDGTGTFILDDTYQASRAGSCAVLHDRDRDGDLDMTGIDEEHDLIELFDNPGPATSVYDNDPSSVVRDFVLGQSYPNPLSKAQIAGRNNSITIPFALPAGQSVSVEVINILGQRQLIRSSERYSAGKHELTLNVNDLATGIYFYRLSAPAGVMTGKMLITK